MEEPTTTSDVVLQISYCVCVCACVLIVKLLYFKLTYVNLIFTTNSQDTELQVDRDTNLLCHFITYKHLYS